MAYAFVPSDEVDPTQWRSEDYRQKWNDYFEQGRGNLLEQLHQERDLPGMQNYQSVSCQALVKLTQSK